MSAAQNKNLRFQPFNLSVSAEELHYTMTSKLYEIILMMSREKQFKKLLRNERQKNAVLDTSSQEVYMEPSPSSFLSLELFLPPLSELI